MEFEATDEGSSEPTDSRRSLDQALVPYQNQQCSGNSKSRDKDKRKKKKKHKNKHKHERSHKDKKRRKRQRVDEERNYREDAEEEEGSSLDEQHIPPQPQQSSILIVSKDKPKFPTEITRTYDSVTKMLEENNAKLNEQLAIEAPTPSSGVQHFKSIDFVRHVLLSEVNEIQNEALFCLERQKELNAHVRANPSDRKIWIQLALSGSLIHLISSTANATEDKTLLQQPKQRWETSYIRRSNLERTRAILESAVEKNPYDLELRSLLLTCIDNECIDYNQLERIYNIAIEDFTNHCANERKDDRLTKALSAKALLHFYREKIRMVTAFPAHFDDDLLHEKCLEAFASITGVHGSKGINRTGHEVAFLFLDFLRTISLMGFTEKACGLIQAVLDVNSSSFGRDSCKVMFQSFWDSEMPRIGDALPAGYDHWNSERRKKKVADRSAATKNVRYKTERKRGRVSASDFFGFPALNEFDQSTKTDGTAVVESNEGKKDFEIRRGKLAEAYVNAVSEPSLLTTKDDPSLSHGNDIDKMIVVSQQSVSEYLRRKSKYSEEIEFEQNAPYQYSPLEKIIANSEGKFLPSTIKRDDTTPGTMLVYSVMHGRSIEVSQKEIMLGSSKPMLRRLLKSLREKKGVDGVDQCITKVTCLSQKNKSNKLYEVKENDVFVEWGKSEFENHPRHHLYNLPLRSIDNSEEIDNDPNRTCLFEDGIGEFVLPFLCDFDDQGLCEIVRCCLSFVGVSFPRSMLHDQNDIRLHAPSVYGAGSEDMSYFGTFAEVFDGVFERSSYDIPHQLRGWKSIYHQLVQDESHVAFNPSLFKRENESKLNFVRNILHELVHRVESGGQRAELWSSYVQMALILFEGEASKNDFSKAQKVARTILSGTTAAKDDPRLWISYALLESKFPEVSSESVLRILLRALEAAGNIEGKNCFGWIDLCIVAVKLILKLPITTAGIDDALTFRSSRCTNEDKQMALHIICCAIEQRYVSIPKKKKMMMMKKDSNESESGDKFLVSKDRITRCRAQLKRRLDELTFTAASGSCSIFDQTPPWYYDAILAAYLEILRPNGEGKQNTLTFSKGNVIDDWIEIVRNANFLSCANGKSGFIRLLHCKLEFGLVMMFSNRKNDCDPACPPVVQILMDTAMSLHQTDCVASPSLLFAYAFIESVVCPMGATRGYGLVLATKLAPTAYEVMYNVLVAIMLANREVSQGDMKDLKHSGVGSKDFLCSKWTRKGVDCVRESLLKAVEFHVGASMPCLWKALIRLELLGGDRGIYGKQPSRAFAEARRIFERGISKCVFSKSLWMDAFTVLRPCFSEEELVSQMAILEDKGIRVSHGVDDLTL